MPFAQRLSSPDGLSGQEARFGRPSALGFHTPRSGLQEGAFVRLRAFTGPFGDFQGQLASRSCWTERISVRYTAIVIDEGVIRRRLSPTDTRPPCARTRNKHGAIHARHARSSSYFGLIRRCRASVRTDFPPGSHTICGGFRPLPPANLGTRRRWGDGLQLARRLKCQEKIRRYGCRDNRRQWSRLCP